MGKFTYEITVKTGCKMLNVCTGYMQTLLFKVMQIRVFWVISSQRLTGEITLHAHLQSGASVQHPERKLDEEPAEKVYIIYSMKSLKCCKHLCEYLRTTLVHDYRPQRAEVLFTLYTIMLENQQSIAWIYKQKKRVFTQTQHLSSAFNPLLLFSTSPKK